MVTISPSPPRRGVGVLRAALIVSLLLHGAFLLFGMIGYDAMVRAFDPSAKASASRAAQNEIVTITSPLTIVRRIAPAAPSSSARHGVERHITPPVGLGFGRPIPTSPPGASAVRLAFTEALARHTARLAVAAAGDPASAPAKYRLTMSGKFAKLKRGQGIYFPTRGWRQDGLDYYDASYEFVYADGSDEKGVVPWPIHFDPGGDPFFSSDPDALRKTPLPGPPPGFVPPGDLGKALRAYFPNLHFEDNDG